MRTAYKQILDTQEDFQVVGVAADGKEALEKAIALVPDVAILDIKMPKMDGIEVSHRILKQYPLTGIVLISAYDDLAFVSAIMKDGANRKAYLMKTSLDDIGELIRVVEPVTQGHSVLDAHIVEMLMDVYNRRYGYSPASFTAMEAKVLGLILEGYDDSYMTATLGLEKESMESIATSACAKLGVTEQNDVDRNILATQTLINRCVA